MSMEESEELKCDREGYFDLDSMRPYSSVWVSTRRDVRPKSVTLEDTDNKKNVAPSRACNNLHSLLETTEGSPATEEGDEELAQAQLSSTKSDQFPLNTYKKFEKNDGTSMKKISDKIIESMCKSDSTPMSNDGDSYRPMSGNSQMDECGQDDLMPEAGEGEMEETGLDSAPASKEKLYKEPSMTSHLGAGEPQEDPMAKGKLLTDSGRLVTEMNLTALNIKDQTGREFPVTVKYVWETDPNEVLNASDNVFNSSSGFVKIVDTVTTVGTKYENWEPTEGSGLLDKTVSWHDNSRSQSSVGTKKRVEGCYPEVQAKESSQGSKGDAPVVRKAPLKDAHTIKHAPTRSKVSFVGPSQEKKNGPGDKKDARADGNRAGSKINVADKKAADKKTRAPVKKKLSTGDDVKAAGTTAARPATFNKREPTPRPAPNRPPSAPTREVTKQPPRIAVQDSGDKLPANNGKRQFGSKFQAPANAAAAAAAAAAGGKFWK